MYFSTLQIKPGMDANTRAIPADVYSEHQTLWKLFCGEQHRDFLFRREQAGHWPLFYTLSQRQPQDAQNIWNIGSQPFQPQLRAGQRLAFMLRANPVVTHDPQDTANPKRRRRDDVVMHARRLAWKSGNQPSQAELIQKAGPAWLEQRAPNHGFKLHNLRTGNYCRHSFHKPGKKASVQFSTLDYEGMLEVTEPQAFITMLQQGLGRSKSFGCGLMLVRRI